MNNNSILEQLDIEIAKLEQAKALLLEANTQPGRRRGRPTSAITSTKAPVARKPRKLSPEGRARIAAAVKARWAKAKKTDK